MLPNTQSCERHKYTSLWFKNSASHSRMFKKVTKSIVKQMDPKGDLVPVYSILDHEHFRPLCLVKRKRKAMFRPSPCYKRTGYRLDDVLLPGEDDESTESLSPTGGGQVSRQFTLKKTISDRVDGNLSLCGGCATIDVRGAASVSKVWSIKLEKNNIPILKLEALKKERKLNMDHAFIQQLKKTQQNLYVVQETVETLEEATYEESTEADVGFKTQFYAKLRAKGTRENKQGIIIPKGCTLAFRAIQLDISDGSWELNYFPEEKIFSFASDGLSQGKIGALQVEVIENCQIVSKLSSNLRIIFLKAIKAVMRDRNLFEELNHKMEAVLDETGSSELKTESPDLKDLLSSLQYSSRHHLLQLTGAITYTLDALDELTEDQLLILLESLEEEIVSQQLKLVESILEHNIEHRKGCFSLDASLLSFSREEEQQLTIAMVEMSGVKLQKDGSAVHTEEAFPAIAALYVSLYVLNLLSDSD
ncbi:gasdermin-A isoform X1 [Grus americana]|uniref:gasdermin-A isoform X1 n=2 Tax=Grus americana TaxID=9117 RepID=UPI00240820D7|nr:gasdermin-A isoform X1 [Grus americana]